MVHTETLQCNANDYHLHCNFSVCQNLLWVTIVIETDCLTPYLAVSNKLQNANKV